MPNLKCPRFSFQNTNAVTVVISQIGLLDERTRPAELNPRPVVQTVIKVFYFCVIEPLLTPTEVSRVTTCTQSKKMGNTLLETDHDVCVNVWSFIIKSIILQFVHDDRAILRRTPRRPV